MGQRWCWGWQSPRTRRRRRRRIRGLLTGYVRGHSHHGWWCARTHNQRSFGQLRSQWQQWWTGFISAAHGARNASGGIVFHRPSVDEIRWRHGAAERWHCHLYVDCDQQRFSGQHGIGDRGGCTSHGAHRPQRQRAAEWCAKHVLDLRCCEQCTDLLEPHLHCRRWRHE